MSDNQVDTEKYDKLSCEQNAKLQKRITELIRYQSREAKCYEQCYQRCKNDPYQRLKTDPRVNLLL